MMKYSVLIAFLIATTLIAVANATPAYVTLSSGTAFNGISTSSDNTVCSYFKLNVGAGTSLIRIDLATDSSDFVSISAGFNFLPVADQNQGNLGPSFLFYDDNVITGNSLSYFICNYNAMTQFSTSTYPDKCSAMQANMDMGGEFFVCISSYDTQTTGTNLTVTQYNATVSSFNYGNLTLAVPSAADLVNQEGMWAYKIYFPSNLTTVSLVTSSDQTIVGAPQLFTDAYTTGNDLGFGQFNVDQYYYFYVHQSDSNTDTVVFTNTYNCNGVTSFAYTTNNELCLSPTTVTSGTPFSANFNSGNQDTVLVTITAPLTFSPSVFYQVNVVNPNVSAETIDVYINSYTAFGEDENVFAFGTFATDYTNSQACDSTTGPVSGHFIAPGTPVDIALSSFGDQITEVTVSITPETDNTFQFSPVGLNATMKTVSFATPTTLSTEWVTLVPFAINSSYNYNLTLTATDDVAFFTLLSGDLSTIYFSLNLQESTMFQVYLPWGVVPTGNYYLLAGCIDDGQTNITYTYTSSLGGNTPVVSSVHQQSEAHHSSAHKSEAHNSAVKSEAHNSQNHNSQNHNSQNHNSQNHNSQHELSSEHEASEHNSTAHHSTQTSGKTSTKSSAASTTLSFVVLAFVAIVSCFLF